MPITDQLAAEDSEIRAAVRDVRAAEEAGAERHDSGSNQNTHFEFKFGHPSVYVYIERYDAEPGVEVLVWADEDWFDEDTLAETDYPSVSDGEAPLSEFAKALLDIVGDELGKDTVPSFEYHSRAPPSLVFHASFYL